MASRFDLALGKKKSKAELEKAGRDKARRQMDEINKDRKVIKSTPRSSRNALYDMWHNATTTADQPETRVVKQVSPVRPNPGAGRIMWG